MYQQLCHQETPGRDLSCLHDRTIMQAVRPIYTCHTLIYLLYIDNLQYIPCSKGVINISNKHQSPYIIQINIKCS